jgi:hypothetical protein
MRSAAIDISESARVSRSNAGTVPGFADDFVADTGSVRPVFQAFDMFLHVVLGTTGHAQLPSHSEGNASVLRPRRIIIFASE